MTSLISSLDKAEEALADLAEEVVDAIDINSCSSLRECTRTNFGACVSRLPGADCVSGDESPSQRCASKGCGFIQGTEKSVVRIPKSLASGPNGNPQDVDSLDSICKSQLIEDDMKAVFFPPSDDEPSPELVHYGSYSGSHRLFPGLPQEDCGAYDPRQQPWYASAASGPKDVFVMVGISDFGSNGQRITSIKRAVQTVLNGLSWADYVNVMSFGEDNRVALGDTLLQATAENLANLREVITDVVQQRESSFQSASSMFDDAYDVLNRSRSQGLTADCNTAIIFITDDMIADGTEADDIVQQLSSNNQGIRANVFSFTIGDSADTALAKRLACASNGVHRVVPDGNEVAEAVGLYYQYYGAARGRRDSSLAVPTWSEPYSLYTTGETATSVSVSVYDNNSDPPVSLGVVSLEYSLASLLSSNTQTAFSEAKRELLSRAGSIRTCSSAQLGACEIEAFRESVSSGSICTSGCSLPGSIFKPATCFPTLRGYPSDLWENTKSSGLSYTSRGCCDEDFHHLNGGGPTCESDSDSSKLLSVEETAGSVMGSIIFFMMMAACCWCCCCRHRKRRRQQQHQQPQAPAPCSVSQPHHGVNAAQSAPAPLAAYPSAVAQPLQAQSVPALQVVHAQPVGGFTTQSHGLVQGQVVSPPLPPTPSVAQGTVIQQETAPWPSAPPPEVPGSSSLSYPDAPPPPYRP
ncbi:unnamed protein product [Chrysoparadoxa australica]